MKLSDVPATLRLWARRTWGGLSGRRTDQDLQRELEAHLALAEDNFRRQGHAPDQAARLARATAGNGVQALEALREQRGLPWLSSSWLDVRLGLRLLVKNWGLTLAGGWATALAISIAAVVFTAFDMLMWSSLPLDEGDRIVAIQVWDRAAGKRRDTTAADFARWRTSLASVRDVGVFQTIQRNVITAEGSVELAAVAQMSDAGFRVARVAPIMGRALDDTDSAPGAAPVVVIGHDVWQHRFGGAGDVIGRELRLGDTVHTIVGVMPPGFHFPLNFRYWIPLPHSVDGPLRNTGPEGVVFGRLASDASLTRAHAEVAALGLLPTAGAPPADAATEARVVRYTFAFTGDLEPGQLGLMGSALSLVLVLLLLPPCANIAILNYARIVTRQQEFVARHALGGSRARIVCQLLIEALVLTTASALVALAVLHVVSIVVTGKMQELPGGPPFWMSFGISLRTVLFVTALALVGAAISGLVPAIQATRRLASLGSGALAGRTSVRLGATWTALVIVQVAFSVGLLPLAAELAWGTLRTGVVGPGFAAEEFATMRVARQEPAFVPPAISTSGQSAAPGPDSAMLAANRARALMHHLLADPSIAGAALALRPPGEEPWVLVDLEGRAGPSETLTGPLPGFRARLNQVDRGFFELYAVPALAGRRLTESDATGATNAVVINRNFAALLAPDGNALGRRFRYVQPKESEWRHGPKPDHWYEVVGIVGNLPVTTDACVAYHAAMPGQLEPAHWQLRLRGDATGLAARVREIVARVDPTLQVHEVHTLAQIYREHRFGDNVGAIVIVGVTASVVLLSAAGLYALMAFTVAQRRREIGIRSALGAPPRQLVAAVFQRTFLQISAGAAAGVLGAYSVGRLVPIEQVGGLSIPGILPGAVAFILLVGTVAAFGPARRLLRVDPTEALRSE